MLQKTSVIHNYHHPTPEGLNEQLTYCKAANTVLYAALGLKLESNNNGLPDGLHESLSLTPQTVIPTQFDWFRQALTTFVQSAVCAF